MKHSGTMNGLRSGLCALGISGTVLVMPAGSALADSPTIGSSSGIIALDSLPNPPTILATAKVVDAEGTAVGAVQKVIMDTSGKPATVDIALLGTHAVVAMSADAFNYDQGHNILMAHLDAQQIAAQPPA